MQNPLRIGLFSLTCLSLLAPAAALAQDVISLDVGVAAKSQKVSSLLLATSQQAQRSDQHVNRNDVIGLKPLAPAVQPLQVPVTADGFVTIDAVAQHDAATLQADLEALGMIRGARFGRMVSGLLPVDRIGELEDLTSLHVAQPALAAVSRGSVKSQGDRAQRSRQARGREKVKGRGVRVGVLSDSYDCLGGAADGIASKDLPPARKIDVLQEGPCPASDEGRAMMEIVADVAPASFQSFHSAFNGQADFATGIIELQQGGADVIVDDIIYFAEPMFQDGIIAQAIDQVVADGAAYFSSAGNNGRDSYESAFNSSGTTGPGGALRHDFDPGPGVAPLQAVTLQPGANFSLVLQWDEPAFSVSGAPGAQSDVDVVFYLDAAGTQVITASADNNIGGDPVELTGLSYPATAPGPVTVYLGIELFAGAQPGLIKYVLFDSGPAGSASFAFATNSSTSYGHATAVGAMATGAAAWFNTELYSDTCKPACLNSFSSAGGIPIFFDTQGNRLAQPDVRLKPEVVGPDGTNNTFFGADITFLPPELGENDGFPNFFGTSASAPHVAGVAALMLEKAPTITPEGIYNVLEATAKDMNEPGPDFDTGFGFINARAAVAAAPAEAGEE